MQSNREQSRKTFDASADKYDRVRPSYPESLIDEAVRLSEIPVGGRILEIGCGTGKATELFAARGYTIDCLDIGSDLASIAAAKFTDTQNVQIVVSSFEDWDPGGGKYDMVIAASSIHWVDPSVRFTKSASVLHSRGALAVFTNKHVKNEEGFFRRVQEVYDARAPSMATVTSARKKMWQEPTVGEELFEGPIVRRYPWVTEYDADEYVALLGTYSDHLSLPKAERESLFEGVRALICEEYDGRVVKHYEAVLTLRRLKE